MKKKKIKLKRKFGKNYFNLGMGKIKIKKKKNIFSSSSKVCSILELMHM